MRKGGGLAGSLFADIDRATLSLFALHEAFDFEVF